MFVDFNYEPLIEDYNSDGSLKIATILKLLENSGNRHSDLAGDKILDSSSKGQTWILTDWYVELESIPKYGDKLTAKTWCQKKTFLFSSLREFELYSNGKLCGKATTRWVFYDINKNCPVKINDELLSKYEPEEKSVFENTKLEKITVSDTFTNEIVLKPRKTDIDFNHHVHNLVYIDYAMEVLPDEIFAKQDFTKIRITYKSAVNENDILRIKYAYNDNKHTIFIYGSSEADSSDTLKTLIQLS